LVSAPIQLIKKYEIGAFEERGDFVSARREPMMGYDSDSGRSSIKGQRKHSKDKTWTPVNGID
jgi:hypothetical protein